MKQPSWRSEAVGRFKTGEEFGGGEFGEELFDLSCGDRGGVADIAIGEPGLDGDTDGGVSKAFLGSLGEGGGVSSIRWYLDRALLADARNSSTELPAGWLPPGLRSPARGKVVFPLVTASCLS